MLPHQAQEDVQAVMMGPMAGTFDAGYVAILEMFDTAILDRVRGPAFRTPDGVETVLRIEGPSSSNR